MTKGLNIIEICNEFFILTTGYFMMLFSEWMFDPTFDPSSEILSKVVERASQRAQSLRDQQIQSSKTLSKVLERGSAAQTKRRTSRAERALEDRKDQES